MIGLIQKVLTEVLDDQGGSALVRAVFERAGEPYTAFRIDRNYSDAQCRALLAAAAVELDLDEDAFCDLYAEGFIRRAEKLFPAFFQMAGNARAFLARQPAIHGTMGAAIRDAYERREVEDKFRVLANTADGLIVEYGSPNRLCTLYAALARRVARRYGESAHVIHEQCMRRGDDCCLMDVRFTKAEEAA
ncbi:heme NO-binding domain-containing protein [Yunchengibacter salinarum]|uniref:heme NO-binding domain-containing protein n=1 Tax=Yunchengibacter salinarum TaxID=3133399 RepID=UPI0035B66659